MGKNSFIEQIKQAREKAKEANDPTKYEPKFTPGQILFNNKYKILTKIAAIRMYRPDFNYSNRKMYANIHIPIPHYVMWDLHNKNYGEASKTNPQMKAKKRVRVCASIDHYYQEASEAQKILFDKATKNESEV